jgi:hypothetical protein
MDLLQTTMAARDEQRRQDLLRIGRAIGFGRAQQVLGELWEREHDCAPRGRMGVTVKDAAPGMAVQALAHEIVQALLADEKDGGYDLTAGMFGPAFSALVRRWAALEYEAAKP